MSPKASLAGFLEDIKDFEFELNAPLAPYTTFGIGGPADVLVFLHSEDQAVHALKSLEKYPLPYFVLGGGSNLLISDKGLRGVIFHLKGPLAELHVNEHDDEIFAGAGASFPKLTRMALGLGWALALGWNGTPGQVGGALIMNAGTRLGEIGAAVQSVRIATAQGMKTLSPAEIQFRYRQTSFQKGVVITNAHLQCKDRDKSKAKELLEKAQELAVKRKQTQPKLRSAGSMFKNPPNDFAGRLIESAGLKGLKQGSAQVSEVHANFIVNTGGASAKDVYFLSERVQEEVFKKHQIRLEYEARRVGDFS